MGQSKSPHTPQSATNETHGAAPQGCLGGIVRMFWMLFGNGALALLSFKIAQSGRVSPLDAVFWVLVVAMVALRYIDITRLAGQTTNCERATLRDWRRYLVTLVGIAAAVWALAHTLLRGFFA